MSLSGAIYIGLSGMNAYSSGLQIISNNVANLDTIGYKAETVSFSDLYNFRGSSGLPFLGSNAAAPGEGVQIKPALSDFSQGTMQQTGNALDLAVQGSGFLVLRSAGRTFYTRTGAFAVGAGGDIIFQGAPAGVSYSLQVLDASNQPLAVNINANRTSAPTATTAVTLSDNLSSTAASATVSNITVHDSAGAAHSWKLTATPSNPPSSVAGQSSWTIAVTDETGANIGGGTVNFIGGKADPNASKITINATLTNGAAPLAVSIDFSGVTSFDAGTTSTLQTAAVDGAGPGSLSSVIVNSTGQLVLNYSNNTTKILGTIAVADFQDPQQLTKVGGSIFEDTGSAGERLLPSGAGGAGSIASGQLESSNVNLTQEFGDLILIQRGYQASSEVVSVSNDMIQQLFGIRGHGG